MGNACLARVMQALFRFSVDDMIARIASFVKGSGSSDEMSARGHSETRKEISLISDWSREIRLVDVTARRLQTYDFMDRALFDNCDGPNLR